MMDSDELARRERQREGEFPETLALFARVRVSMVERLFRTPLAARDEREMLYTKVQALDALSDEMRALLHSGSDAVEDYVKTIESGA